MARYRLSKAADEDLDRLFVYGITTFGLPQAEKYVVGLCERLTMIARSPLRWPGVSSVREGYRRCVYGRHSIYYRINSDTIEVMRILGRESMEGAFEDEEDDNG